MSQFYECANDPVCTLGVDGSKKVSVDYGPGFCCKNTTHPWHSGPLTWYDRSLGGLCPDHACQREHDAGEPRPAPPPVSRGGGHAESAEQAALRARFYEQEKSA
jgi:hypothetical protein